MSLMQRLRCDHAHLPAYLYRAQYHDSNTTLDANGLSAATQTFDEHDIEELRQSVVDHFTWSNRSATPYISLFSDRRHAENWAVKMGVDSILLVVDTTLLGDVDVFRLSTLLEELAATIPEAASQHITGAYLCLRSIPHRAITPIAFDRRCSRPGPRDIADPKLLARIKQN